MLRYHHYALSWDFNPNNDLNNDLNNTALFSLLINKHDIKAKEIINEYVRDNRGLSFGTVFKFSRVEWLPPASKKMALLLIDSFPDNSDINYIVSSWNIMSDYENPNLKYAHDHNLVYKSVGKKIPKHKYGIKISSHSHSMIISENDDDICGDNVINLGTKEDFDKVWNKPDLNSIYGRVDYTDYDWAMDMFKDYSPNYELEEEI